MRTPPVVVSYTELTFTTVGGSRNATVTWQAGDLIVYAAGGEDAMAIAAPTATGLTFTSQKSNSAASSCSSQLATAIAAADGSAVTLTGTTNNGSLQWGAGIWVVRKHAGFVGNSYEQHTSTRTVTTTIQHKQNLILWAVFDFAGAALVVESPTAKTDHQQVRSTSHYTVYLEESYPQGRGTLAVGVGGAGSGAFSIIALEVIGTGMDEQKRSRRLR